MKKGITKDATTHTVSEQRIQHDLIMWFSQTYPELQGRLFMVQNNTYSQSHGNRMKSLGMVKGVSDLMFIGNGFVAGIELKAPESVHSVAHIKEQMRFGEMLNSLNHYFIMTSSLDQVKSFIIGCINGHHDKLTEMQTYQYDWIEEKLINKTIKF